VKLGPVLLGDIMVNVDVTITRYSMICATMGLTMNSWLEYQTLVSFLYTSGIELVTFPQLRLTYGSPKQE
jgi:hypothetical protein